MALSLTHTFVCGIADDAAAQAAGEILPSHWNAALTTSMATAKVLGRATAGTGAIEELGTTGTGDVVLAAAPTITGHPTIEGVTATGATGTGKFVFDTSPTLVTPLLGTPTSGTLTNCTGLPAAGVVGTAAVLGANTFTALQTINGAANAQAVSIVGGGVTGSNATALFNITQTYNTTSYPQIFNISVTNTASDTYSTFFDCRIGATPKFSVTTLGLVNAAAGYSVAPLGQTLTGFSGSATVIDTSFAGTAFWRMYNSGGVGFYGRSDAIIGWSSTTNVASGSMDTAVSRNAAGVVEVNNGTAGTFRDLKLRDLYAGSAANGQVLGVKHLTELLTIAAAATSTTTIQIPAGAIVLGVSVRVTTAVTCTSTFTVGDAGVADRYSTAAVSKAVNSTDKGTKAGAYYNTTATGIVITPDTTPSDATGRVRVTIHYIEVTAPTS